MEKNQNRNFENRVQRKKNPANRENLSIYSCTISELKQYQIFNGRLWHTTDTNEFYYDWKNKRFKLNITDNIDGLNAEIVKIQSELSKLNILELRINNAISDAQEAAEIATNAAQSAQDVLSQIADKADKSYVDEKISESIMTSDEILQLF